MFKNYIADTCATSIFLLEAVDDASQSENVRVGKFEARSATVSSSIYG